LRQIRLEANLPPEGLPESQKLSERAIANTIAAKKQASSAQSTSSLPSEMEKNAGPKRKGTAEEEEGTGKKKRPTSKVGEESDEIITTPTTQQILPSAMALQLQSPASSSASNVYHSDQQNLNLASLFSQAQVPGANFSSPHQFSPYSGSSINNDLVSSLQRHDQDSNAILASLFDANDMGNFMGQQIYGGGPPGPLMGLSTDSPAYMNSLRQKTVPKREESEEIKRLNDFAQELRTNKMRFGSPKEEEELLRVVEAISQLIHEMDTFRRQPSHQLPSLLEPNDIQQSRPHDPFIDALPFSGLRQRLIECQDSLSLDEVFISLLYHTDLHPGDVTKESNWEIRQGFVFTYPQLIDRQTLAYGNHWRSTREESTFTYENLIGLVQ
jgi:hypothetical protein